MSTEAQKPTDVQTEIETLKKEIVLLREQLKQLTRFIHYRPASEDDDGRPLTEHLFINCCGLMLADPRSPGKHQVHLMTSTDGPFLNFFDTDEKVRVHLSVQKGLPEISLRRQEEQRVERAIELRDEQGNAALNLFAKQDKVAVQIRADGQTADGLVGVCHAGKARAVMKSVNDTGCISAVHDDGHARITMLGSPSNGELLAVTPDMKVGVKIQSDALDGGLITVNRANGKAGIIISNTPIGGTVIVNDPQGNISGTLPVIGGEAEE